MAQHAAKSWLERRRKSRDRTASLAELAAEELSSVRQRAKLDHLITGIGHQVGDQLEPLLAAKFASLPAFEVRAAMDAVVDGLAELDLSDEALLGGDGDPELLARRVRATLVRDAGLSEQATRLYEIALDQACRYLIQVIRHLPAFQPRALAEVLNRASLQTAMLEDVLSRLPRTSLHAPTGTDTDEEFRDEYLRYIAGTLDRLELLGLTMRHRPKLALSVAYLSPSVTGGVRRTPGSGADRWFGGDPDQARGGSLRVEAAIGDAHRTLVRGEAGSGKVLLDRMSPDDVRVFLRRWHEAARDAESLPCAPEDLPEAERRLLRQSGNRPHLRALAASPLLCAMLCALNLGRSSELPQSRMELYRAALTMLLDLRDAERQITGMLTGTEKTVLLRDLAWRLIQGNRSEFPIARATEFVSHKLRSVPGVDLGADAVLTHLLERSGVLREPVPGRVDFVHRTFQEYLAASEATELEHVETLAGNAHLDTWRETIVMACGHGKRSQTKALLTQILDRADDEPPYARRLRLLAAACLETVTDVDADVHERIDTVIRERLAPPRSMKETRSLASLGHRVLRYLPDTLDGLSDAAAAATVRAVALTGSAEAIPRLARYAQDGRKGVQTQLAQAWEYFDPERYANEVLADAPLVNGLLKVENHRFLPHVTALRNLAELHVRLSHDNPQRDLHFIENVPHVTELWVRVPGTVDLRPLVRTIVVKPPLAARCGRLRPRRGPSQPVEPPRSGLAPEHRHTRPGLPATPTPPDLPVVRPDRSGGRGRPHRHAGEPAEAEFQRLARGHQPGTSRQAARAGRNPVRMAHVSRGPGRDRRAPAEPASVGPGRPRDQQPRRHRSPPPLARSLPRHVAAAGSDRPAPTARHGGDAPDVPIKPLHRTGRPGAGRQDPLSLLSKIRYHS
nr:hypothetical protein [Saccharothrix deserti]